MVYDDNVEPLDLRWLSGIRKRMRQELRDLRADVMVTTSYINRSELEPLLDLVESPEAADESRELLTLPIDGPLSQGICNLCQAMVNDLTASGHLIECIARQDLPQALGPEPAQHRQSLHLSVHDGSGLYWLELAVRADTTLRQLDEFLRGRGLLFSQSCNGGSSTQRAMVVMLVANSSAGGRTSMVAEKYAVQLSAEDRDQLERLIRSGQRSARVINRARILLKTDEGWSASQAAAALDTSPRTVFRIKRRYAEEGLDGVLHDHPQASRFRKLDDKAGAHLIALACSPAREGRDHWTLQLLADRMVELGLVASLSHEAVRLRLKKTPSSRGASSSGASRR